MSATPDVSVVMAAWKAEDFIAASITSVLAQDDVELELIVIDDASPDDTVGAVQRAACGDRRLILEQLAENGGPSAVRNRGLERAKGRYIAVVDCDDTLEPGRLSLLMEFADRTKADIVADNMSRVSTVGACGQDGEPFLSEQALDAPVRISLADYLNPITEVRFGESLGYLKPLFRRETLLKMGLSYDVSLRNSEDFYFVASLLAEGAAMQLHPSRGYNYLVRSGSISHRLSPDLTAAILNAEAAFYAKYSPAFDPKARLAQEKRTVALRNLHSFERVVDALKSRKPHGVLSALVDHPGAMPHVASRLANIAAAKFRRSAQA